MGRWAGERAAGGATAAARQALDPGGSRPPAVLVVLAAVLVAGTITASVVGAISLLRGPGVPTPPPAAVAAPPQVATPPVTPTTTAAEATPTPAPTVAAPAPPADPRDVIQDPALRTLAEPFLTGPGVSCQPRDPGPGATESVACDLGRNRTAVFSRMRTPDAMRDVRRGMVAGQNARPGTVVSVRWRYVPGRPQTRDGVVPGRTDRGEGVRVRYVDRGGVPQLYFDQDSSGCIGELALTRATGNARADLEALRTYWANPTS